MMKYIDEKALGGIAGGDDLAAIFILRPIQIFTPPANDAANLSPPAEALGGFLRVQKDACHNPPGSPCPL